MTHRVTGLRLWCRRRRFLTAVRGQGSKEGRDSDAGMPSAIAEVVNERCDDLTLDQRPGIRNVIAKDHDIDRIAIVGLGADNESPVKWIREPNGERAIDPEQVARRIVFELDS